MIEDGGVCTRNILARSNQFPRDVCGCSDCGICCGSEQGQTGVRCSVRSVGYEGICAKCISKHAYIGETSKTAYTRIKQHLTAYRAAAAANLPAYNWFYNLYSR